MKTTTRRVVALLSLLLACTLLASAWITPTLAAPPAEKLSDEQDRITTEITAPKPVFCGRISRSAAPPTARTAK